MAKSTPPRKLAFAPGTKEHAEQELKELAAKAREETSLKHTKEQLVILLKAAVLLTVAATYSNVSQLALSPIYGSIPSSIWHPQVTMAACFAGWSGTFYVQQYLPRNQLTLLGPIAFYIPSIQFFLFKLSGTMGATAGPVVTEVLTLFPLLALSVSCVATLLEDLDLGVLPVPKPLAESLPGIGSYALFRTAVFQSAKLINATIGQSFFQTRIGLQLLLGAVLSAFKPSKLLRLAVPALLHTGIFNTHLQSPYTSNALNATLNNAGWTILARQESLTGYISVLESQNDGFRIMRCDHSLLGGEWIRMPNGMLPGTAPVKEPIYAIFAMLEAVRLIEVPVPVLDKDAQALVIGLGIGTTPAALMAHGINTTIVEIDPTVHEYAVKYFALPPQHTAVIQDAVSYTDHLANNTDQKYDYVVHDVFTGGAEPVDLFTVEFMRNLYSVLKPNGVIAINYAGDLLLPSARLIVRTIKSVFSTCRIFREMATPSAETLEEDGQDFTNMVIFCLKSSSSFSSPGSASANPQLKFRQPVAADFLKSGARKEYLLPKHEIEAEVFAEQEGDGEVLSKDDTDRLTKWQVKSAVGHWNVMRTVLPDLIWELW